MTARRHPPTTWLRNPCVTHFGPTKRQWLEVWKISSLGSGRFGRSILDACALYMVHAARTTSQKRGRVGIGKLFGGAVVPLERKAVCKAAVRLRTKGVKLECPSYRKSHDPC